MIILVAALAILLLISIVVNFHLNKTAQDMRANAYKFEQKWLDASQELIMAKKPQLNEQEHGRFVKHRSLRKPTARTYQLVFDVDPNGQRIIEHLASLFCRNAFVADDKGGERETSRRLGEQNVISYILNQINKANNPNYEEEINE